MLTLNQIKRIIDANKNSFRADQTRLIGYFIAHKTNMDLKLATAIAKGIVDNEVK